MIWLKAFAAGFLSTLIFHQGAQALLNAIHFIVIPPYAIASTEPFGVPRIASLAFWGGVWGMVVWPLLRPQVGAGSYWFLAIVTGAIAPSLVAWFIVFPLKGAPVAGGGDIVGIIASLVVNAAWGFGLAVLMRLFGATR